MGIVDVDGTLAWRERGSGAPIVFLHGLGGSRSAWGPQLDGLGDRWRCLAWDLPGYGASAPLDKPVTFTALADAAARWIELVGGTAHVVGMSFGGMIAQYLAANHPDRVRSLTLMATSPKFGLDGTDPHQWRAARLGALDHGVEPADFAHVVLSGLAGPSITSEALAGQEAAMARISSAALRTSIDCIVTHDTHHLLGRINAPTQCLVGEADEETPVSYSEAIAAGIPHARVLIIPGAGHLLHVEAPDAVNALIDEHCSRWEAAR
jgi:pimeloyl-ACP methyl ester carboxylesterase